MAAVSAGVAAGGDGTQLGVVHGGVGRGAMGIPAGQFAGGGGGGTSLIGEGGIICSVAEDSFAWVLCASLND